MRLFKFQYNIDAPAEVAPAGPSIAAVAAKSGRLVQPGEQGERPSINISEKKEEATPAPAPPALAIDAKPAVEAKTESLTPATETKKEEPQIVAPEKTPIWQEVLKSQQPDTILKELGYGEKLVDFLKENKDLDPKLLGFLSHWKSNDGNVEPYLRALTTDFTKMNAEDVMKHQLQVQNPELDAKQLDRLYKLKVVDRYKLDPQLYSEDEVADGQIELSVDVKPIRTQLSEQQQNYLFPKPAPKETVVDNSAQQQQQRAQAFKSYIDSHPAIKSLLTNKMVSFGEGEDKYDFPVDADDIYGLVTDADKFANSLYLKNEKADGTSTTELDVEKQILMGLVARHGKGFLKQHAQYYKNLGGKSAIAPIENAKPPAIGEPAKAEKTASSPAAAAAKHGRLVSSGQ